MPGSWEDPSFYVRNVEIHLLRPNFGNDLVIFGKFSNFWQFFLRKKDICARKCRNFWKMDSFYITVKLYKILNFVTIRGLQPHGPLQEFQDNLLWQLGSLLPAKILARPVLSYTFPSFPNRLFINFLFIILYQFLFSYFSFISSPFVMLLGSLWLGARSQIGVEGRGWITYWCRTCMEE